MDQQKITNRSEKQTDRQTDRQRVKVEFKNSLKRNRELTVTVQFTNC